MIQQKIMLFSKYFTGLGANKLLISPQVCSICTSCSSNINQKWREERGLPANPNAYGVLTDAPDYTFLDGRPTPYGVRQKKRLLKQKQVTEQIIKLTGEIDFAVERHKLIALEKKRQENEIIANKLKPKGVLLLKK